MKACVSILIVLVVFDRQTIATKPVDN